MPDLRNIKPIAAAAIITLLSLLLSACGQGNTVLGEWEPQQAADDEPFSAQSIATMMIETVTFEEDKVILNGKNAMAVDEYDIRDEQTFVMLANGQSFSVKVVDKDEIRVDMGSGYAAFDRVN